MRQTGEHELPRKLLDRRNVARILGLNPETVRRMVARGELPALKLAGRLRFDPRALSEWMARRR